MNVDYKKKKQEAKNSRTYSQSSSNTTEPYYKRKSNKPKPSKMEIMDEDNAEWAKGKLRSGALFSDSDSDHHQPISDSSNSENEKPVPVRITKQNQAEKNKSKQSKQKPQLNIIKPPVSDSSSDSDVPKKRKKKAKNSRKGVFSDSGESSSDDNNNSDSSEDKASIDKVQPNMLQNAVTWLSEPGYVSKAKTILRKTINDRGSSKLSVAFKGGKESSILLHLIKAVMDELQLSYDILDVVYFAPVSDDIKLLNEYVNEYIKEMKMSKCLKIVKADDITEGLQRYMNGSNVNTMMIGIKSTDTGAKSLQPNMQTQDIVELNRVHPLLSWTYKDVWDYINTNNVNVCNLYSLGYTKLQTSLTTTRNPLLSDKKSNKFTHADKLLDPSREDWSVFECLEGKVLKGASRGRMLMGVPTARVDANPNEFQDGVYVGKARVNEVDKKYRKAVISISSRIDISGKHKRTIAVHISHKYSTDFYGKYMSVHILGLLRKQQQYDNQMALRNAMDQDIKYLESIIIDREMKI